MTLGEALAELRIVASRGVEMVHGAMRELEVALSDRRPSATEQATRPDPSEGG